MTGNHIYTLEDESPGNIGGTTDNFGIHQVAHTNGTSTDGGHDGHIIQNTHDVELHVAGIEPQGKHQTPSAAMTGKTLVAGKLPTAIGQLTDGQNHLYGVRKEIGGFVEKAMTQSGTYKYAKETVHEHRFELLFGNLLLSVQTMHEQINSQQADAPAERVPAESEEA